MTKLLPNFTNLNLAKMPFPYAMNNCFENHDSSVPLFSILFASNLETNSQIEIHQLDPPFLSSIANSTVYKRFATQQQT